jgi:hypothetical protein
MPEKRARAAQTGKAVENRGKEGWMEKTRRFFGFLLVRGVCVL